MIGKRIVSLALAIGLFVSTVGPTLAASAAGASPKQPTDLAEKSFVHRVDSFARADLDLRTSAAATAEKSCAGSGSPYCSAYVYRGVHWKAGARVVYFVDMNYSKTKSPTLTNGAAMTAVYGSFRMWGAAMPASGGLTFVYGGTTKVTPGKVDGKNVVGWGWLPSGTLAETSVWYRPSTGQIVEADLKLNSRYSWAYTPPTGCTITTVGCNPAPAGPSGSYDLRNIATHEVGHMMMLDDLYGWSNRGLTMYGYASPRQRSKDSLGYGEKLGVRAIYARQ